MARSKSLEAFRLQKDKAREQSELMRARLFTQMSTLKRDMLWSGLGLRVGYSLATKLSRMRRHR